MSGRYDDILHLTHPEPIDRPRMARETRAAQFAPFAALVGYDDTVREVARETDARIELSEDAIEDLNAKLLYAADHGGDVELLHFVPDRHKDGGAYISRRGSIRRLDSIEGTVVLSDGAVIRVEDILDIQLI